MSFDKIEEIPDLRSTFYIYLNMPTFDDPQRVYQESLEALSGYMDMDTLLGAAFPLFHRLGQPLARLPIIEGTLNYPNIAENEAAYLLRVLIDTGSAESYRPEIEDLIRRFPNLRSILN